MSNINSMLPPAYLFNQYQAPILDNVEDIAAINIPAQEINALPTPDIKRLDARLLNALSIDVIKSLHARVIENLQAKALSQLDAKVINNLSDEVIQHLHAGLLNSLAANTISSLQAQIIEQLKPKTIKKLEPRFFKYLPHETFKELCPHVKGNLSAKTLKWLGKKELHLERSTRETAATHEKKLQSRTAAALESNPTTALNTSPSLLKNYIIDVISRKYMISFENGIIYKTLKHTFNNNLNEAIDKKTTLSDTNNQILVLKDKKHRGYLYSNYDTLKFYINENITERQKKTLRKDELNLTIDNVLDKYKGKETYFSRNKAKFRQVIFRALSKVLPNSMVKKRLKENVGQRLFKGNMTGRVNFKHILNGSINANGEATGGHYLQSPNVRLEQSNQGKNRQGISTGYVSILNPNNQQWIRRLTSTSFFPSSWSEKQLKSEVQFAFMNSQAVLGEEGKWQGRSPSGILIQGFYQPSHFVPGALQCTSAWPVYQ